MDRGSPGGRARRRKRNICGGGAVPEIANSVLATYLQECWSWGKYSPPECQRLAHLAMIDIRRAQQCSELELEEWHREAELLEADFG